MAEIAILREALGESRVEAERREETLNSVYAELQRVTKELAEARDLLELAYRKSTSTGLDVRIINFLERTKT